MKGYNNFMYKPNHKKNPMSIKMWINKQIYYTMKYFSMIERNVLSTHAITG